ncbi:hypothetical protein K491DRAFT_680895 [Lophiostoma macrostomum CBS 122681]|uniref:NADP-dependent oxidoreductase domain-containing protein n=1 Tax=Lophiostoma macrostomum CBS 122681 TaxID=1314788 RepID=A0A6A6T349_9PLEO|nr:hypothetical protein K491DRAFT_680895 [Lophiostoma macrostomum CBS 122681]
MAYSPMGGGQDEVGEQALIHLETAYDTGIRFFDCTDTSPANESEGEGEKLLGRAIRRFRWKREDIVVAIKISPLMSSHPIATHIEDVESGAQEKIVEGERERKRERKRERGIDGEESTFQVPFEISVKYVLGAFLRKVYSDCFQEMHIHDPDRSASLDGQFQEHITDACDASLERLQFTYVDVAYAPRPVRSSSSSPSLLFFS